MMGGVKKKTKQKWLKVLFLDGVMFTLLILGVYYKIPAAKNLTIFIVWFTTLAVLISLILYDEIVKDKKENKKESKVYIRSRIKTHYHWITEVLYIGILVAAGWFTTAITRLLGCLLSEAIYEKQLKQSVKEEQDGKQGNTAV